MSSAEVWSCPCQDSDLSSCLEFQSDGPTTEKARGPSVLSRHCNTTKKTRRKGLKGMTQKKEVTTNK